MINNIFYCLSLYGFIIWIMFLNETNQLNDNHSTIFNLLPLINAILNTLIAFFLIIALISIKKKNIYQHKFFMSLAGALSILFWINYLIYHFFFGHTPFQETGISYYIYFTILYSHIALAIFALPLILYSYYFAFNKQFQKHKTIARYTFPIWLYVSISGVIVYILLHTLGGN